MLTAPSPCRAGSVLSPGMVGPASQARNSSPGIPLSLGRNVGPLDWAEQGWPRERSENLKYRAL